MKKYFLLLLLPLITGCWDVNEPENMYYIHGLGVDYKEEQFEIYAQVIDFTNIAKSEQPNPEAIQAEVGFAKGKTLDEAFFSLYKTMDERLFLGHLSYVVFSENLLKEDKASSIVNAFIRYRELRYTTWVYTTKNPLDELMLITPILNKSITLSKLSNPKSSYGQSSLIEPLNFRQMTILLDEPGHEATIPFVEIESNWVTEDSEDKIHSINGVGVISKDGLKGFLLNDDARGLQWMTNKGKRNELTFELEDPDDPYVTVVVKDVKAEINPIVEGQRIDFDLNISLHVEANEKEEKNAPQGLKKTIEDTIKKEIKKTYTVALDKEIDIYRLSEAAYRKEVRAWKKVEQDGKVPLTESSIRNINVEVVEITAERTSSE